MKGRALPTAALLLLAAAGGAACDGREILVFDVAMPGGAAGSISGGAAGMGGTTGGAASGASGAGSAGSGAGSASIAGGGTSLGGSYGGYAGSNAGTGGVGGMPPKTPCVSMTDCMPGWQCEKPSCDAPMGVCLPPPPVFCEPDPAPVCGCDGVTYWNDCVRRQIGVQAESAGECSVTACACGIDADCADDSEFAVCAHLVQGGETCHDENTGACWVLPPQCMPNFGDPPVWQECRPPDAPPAPCVDTCLAIASGHPHKRKKPGDECSPP